jgi:hypothetical protein
MFLNSFWQLLILLIVVPSIVQNAFVYDLTQASIHGTPIQDLVCNKDTVIDFNFSPSSKLSGCSSNCTTVIIYFIFLVLTKL